ncbi:hypothetical protein G6F31_014298 [Rhizopus arrhizus]|nr:hypothetical protein G6F31_014298 [Rhizopus arrhizus]
MAGRQRGAHVIEQAGEADLIDHAEFSHAGQFGRGRRIARHHQQHARLVGGRQGGYGGHQVQPALVVVGTAGAAQQQLALPGRAEDQRAQLVQTFGRRRGEEVRVDTVPDGGDGALAVGERCIRPWT